MDQPLREPFTDRLTDLSADVSALYSAKAETRGEWADWLYEFHVREVAGCAAAIARRYGAEGDDELAWAGGLLHDVADAVTSRSDPAHSDLCASLATELLDAAGFSSVEIEVVGAALATHSCRPGELPVGMVARAVAAGDAVVHLCSDFFVYAARKLDPDWPVEQVKAWALEKIERDYATKISFDEVRAAVEPSYRALRTAFGDRALPAL